VYGILTVIEMNNNAEEIESTKNIYAGLIEGS
jgi:hypothetical protein